MHTTQQKPVQKPSYVKDLVLLFSIPLGIALIAAVAVYVPRSLSRPSYDFIYSYCREYRCQNTFELNSNGRVVAKSLNEWTKFYDMEAQLRYFDVSEKSSRSISLEEANDLSIDSSSKAPDGYTLEHERGSGGGFLFWGDYRDSWQLVKGWKKTPVTLSTDENYYSKDIAFLGWVK